MLKNPLFTDKPVQTVARVENKNASICPVCGNQMTVAKACDIAVYTCLTHRIVMPMEDYNV